jgi:nucleotide-binding universal stress UspA family protein
MNQIPSFGLPLRMLFCTDFSPGASQAFDFAIATVRNTPGAQLHLLHVIPETDAQFWKSYIYEVDRVDAQAKHDIHCMIRDAYLSRVPSGIEVKVELRIGKAAEKILEVAAQKQVTMILLGRESAGGLSAALFGNVVEKVVRKAHCPVLVIPAVAG